MAIIFINFIYIEPGRRFRGILGTINLAAPMAIIYMYFIHIDNLAASFGSCIYIDNMAAN